MSGSLILLRHGQSTWNAENRFTGWVDVDLTERGRVEAAAAGRLLATLGLLPDVVYTSLLRRAIVTAHLALDAADRLWVPQERSWCLNERHYGALAGLDRTETAERFGAEQVRRWRRSYFERPPRLEDLSEFHQDPRYADLDSEQFPAGESLADVERRLLPYWEMEVSPRVASGARVLVVAHGNSLRALVKNLEHLSDTEIEDLEIPTGTPRVYHHDTRTGLYARVDGLVPN